MILNLSIYSIILVELILTNRQNENETETRIMNGYPCSTNEHPFIVRLNLFLEEDWIFICGGSLIHSNWVLTAAHCLVEADFNPPNSAFQIIAAANSNNPIQVNVKDYFIHPQYLSNKIKVINDIALLKLEASLNESVDGIKFIKLPTKEERVYDPPCFIALVIGWGLTDAREPEKQTTINDLQCGNPKMGKFSDCYDFVLYKARTYLCTIPGTARILAGDSGGPLVCNGVQVGIMSFTFPNKNYPDIYTNVKAYLDFIQDTLNGRLHVPSNCKTLLVANPSLKVIIFVSFLLKVE